MAARLDPFARIVGVSWPAAGLAVDTFRTAFTITHRPDGLWQYGLAFNFHGDVTALFVFPDAPRVTFGGSVVTLGPASAATYSAAVTFGTGVFEPIIATPAGSTTLNQVGTIAPFFPDSSHERAELLRGGVPVIDLDVSAWALYSRTVGAFPGLNTFKQYYRHAP